MSCYLILIKWENPQLPAKKQVFQTFVILNISPYIKNIEIKCAFLLTQTVFAACWWAVS